jgi:NADH-quinone oxidoreductase subunit G
VNSEGRAQRYYQVFVPEGDIRAGWQWINDIMQTAGSSPVGGSGSLDGIISELAREIPEFAPIRDLAPHAEHRIEGMKVPRQHHRFSGRTAMTADIDVSEPGPPEDPTTPLSFSMEGYEGRPSATLISRYWHPRWNSVQALNKFQQEVAGPLLGGEAGRLLLASAASGALTRTAPIPGSFTAQPGRWLLVPRHHLFGSEELSSRTQDAREMVPKPYIALCAQDAAMLGLESGDLAEVSFGDVRLGLTVVIAQYLPAGVAAYPFGPQFPFAVNAPVFCAITKRPLS